MRTRRSTAAAGSILALTVTLTACGGGDEPTAASANPLLTTLVDAVTGAGLGDTLNSAAALTVFAPTDDAFAKIPANDKKLLATILTHHVLAGRIAPQDLPGKPETLAGHTVVVRGSGEDLTVGKEDSAVLCGNIPTAKARSTPSTRS